MLRVWSGRATQYASAFIGMLGMVCAGLHMGWASPALPKLLSGTAGFQITRDDSSWIVSMLTLGSMPGCLVARFTVDRIGRKTTMLLSAWPYCAAWFLIMFADSAAYLYAAQLLAGVSLGMGLVVTSMYCGEIAEKEIRGSLSSTLNFGMNIGSLLSYAIGPYFSYKTVAYITVGFPVVFFLACLSIPESPYYYLIKGDKQNARLSLMKLRDAENSSIVDKELDEMEANVKDDLERRGGLKELFSKKIYRNAIIIIIGIRSLQQLCGNMAIISYMQIIFDATSTSLESSVTTIIYGVVQVTSGFIATIATDRLGRKPLLYFSSIGHSIALTAIGAYFFLQDYLEYDEETMAAISWIPLASIMLFCVCYSVGIGSLGYVLLSEYFPTNVKSIAVSCGSIYGSFMAFSVSKLYLVVADAAGVYVAFWIFAGCCYFGLAFTHFVVPETKNKSFAEIQKKLNRNKDKSILLDLENQRNGRIFIVEKL